MRKDVLDIDTCGQWSIIWSECDLLHFLSSHVCLYLSSKNVSLFVFLSFFKKQNILHGKNIVLLRILFNKLKMHCLEDEQNARDQFRTIYTLLTPSVCGRRHIRRIKIQVPRNIFSCSTQLSMKISLLIKLAFSYLLAVKFSCSVIFSKEKMKFLVIRDL